MQYTFIPLLLLLCFLIPAGCANVPKLLEKGKYERAYEVALRRCTSGRATKSKSYDVERYTSNRKPLKQKRIDEFFSAYAAVQQQDFTRSKLLRAGTSGEKWARLYPLYSILHDRSLDLVRLFPADANFTGHAELLPANLEAQKEEARRAAGKYALSKAAPLLPAAREGYKAAARTAYHHYSDALNYLPERSRELLPTQDSLADIGTLRLLLYAPEQEQGVLLRDQLKRHQTFYRYWTAIHTQDPGQRIDLEAEVVYQNWSDSGVSESSSEKTYSKKVLDYIEKKKVKVKVNDTTEVEKIIEIKHYKEVFATVTTITLEYSVSAHGFLAVYHPGDEQPHWEKPLRSSNSWCHRYSICSGDKRALPASSCNGTYRSPPSARSLLSGAIRRMASNAHRHLVNKYAPKLRRAERKEAERWGLF